MAVTSGTVTNVWGITTPLGPKSTTAGLPIYSCFITVNITGTYDQSADSRVLLVTTAIANNLHNGKTIALLDACFVAPGLEAGVAIGAKTTAIATTGITFELTGGDMTTEHAAAALGTLSNDICFLITYTEA